MTLNLKFSWWDEYDKEPVELHQEALTIHAMEHATEMIKQGYSSGQLLYEFADVPYQGWWELE